MSHAEKALATIRKVKVENLVDWDGCYCFSFDVCGVNVNLSCHKSEHCLRVYPSSSWYDVEGLELIAKEVLRQFSSMTNGGGEYAYGYRLRFCSYSHDHVNGRYEGSKWVYESRCCYCHAPRERDEYLCSECRVKQERAAQYPWTSDGFLVQEGRPQ